MNHNANDFAWNENRKSKLNQLIHDASKDIRVTRPFLKLYGTQGKYIPNIVGHRVTQGSPLSVSITQNLTPAKLSCDIKLQQEQFSDEDALNTLVVEAAYRVAAAEDAVILLGREAKPFLKRLGVNAGDNNELDEQTGLISEAPTSLPPEQPILDSIVQGITDLGNNGRYRGYTAVVSLDLYQEAMRSRQNPFDAPIYEIRPLLVDDGFRYSQALPQRTGVIFSQSGDGVKIAVPLDTSVEFVEEKKDVFLQVVEQIRLVVDVPEAVVPLRAVR